MDTVVIYIRNESPTRPLRVDLPGGVEAASLLSGADCGIAIRAVAPCVFTLSVGDSQLTLEAPTGMDARFRSLHLAGDEAVTPTPQGLGMLLKNSRGLPLSMMQEPWAIERKVPPGESLLFEECRNPQADPLLVRWQDHMLIIESWIPPEDEIVRTVTWN